MSRIEEIEQIVERIPRKWRLDFCRLIEGENPSVAFLAFFDDNTECQQEFSRMVRVLDEDISPIFRSCAATK
ncbi:MAG: hypothetical protein WEB58_23375 [Planctomycetaceae bacterium]